MKKELFFRGGRNYIHGADILDTVLSYIQTTHTCNIDYVVTKPATTQVECVPFALPYIENSVAQYKDNHHHLLVITNEKKISLRVVDDEVELEKQFFCENATLTVQICPKDVSLQRLAVVAFKCLLGKIHGAGVYKYKFVRLVYAKIWTSPFTVTYSRTVGGRFFEGIIRQVDGGEIGKMYFGQGAA